MIEKVEIGVDNSNDKANLIDLINWLPTDFLKLLELNILSPFHYLNGHPASFRVTHRQDIERSIDDKNNLVAAFDNYRGRIRATGLNVALRNMKKDGLISDDDITRINKIITSSIDLQLQKFSRDQVLSALLFRKIKSKKSLSIAVDQYYSLLFYL